MTGPADGLGRATAWLAQGLPQRLADRLVAARTHDTTTAAHVEEQLVLLAEQVNRLGPDRAAVRLLGPDQDPAVRQHHQLVLATSAAVAQIPAWPPPAVGPRILRRLDPAQRGLIRLMARSRPDRVVPVALADQGVMAAQMVGVTVDDVEITAGTVSVAMHASQRGTVSRVVELDVWSHQAVTRQLRVCRHVGTRPCYRGQHAHAAKVAKAITARIDRVIADTGVPATAASLRYTAGHDAFDAGGPVDAMRVLGCNSIATTLRLLDRGA